MWGAVARGVAGSIVGEVAVNLALNTNGFNKDVSSTIKSTENSFGSSLKKIGGFIASAFAIGKVIEFGKEAVNAASASQSAWTGLYSIVDGTGKSFTEAKGFIEEYISDGLVPLENATTAYKNLAARGYSTEQIEGVMTSLKDAAAFGRQASYSLGDAVTSATEGLKNENSILVDNAGVTKNVAKMWDEYAKSIGTTANNLTQEQKIQAEVNGIMQETKFQTGDAATYANTFAGRTAQLSTAFLNLKTAVGKVVGPIASIFIPIITTAMNAVTKFLNKVQQLLSVFGFKWQDVMAKDTSSSIANIGSSASDTASSIGSIGDSATETAKKLKRSLGKMDELNVLSFGSNASSSGAGGAGGGVAGLGDAGLGSVFDNVITEDPISPQIKKIADKIKSYLAPLKEIDLSKLSGAFDNLKKSLEPITKKLLEGLDWLWFNILVPLAEWTIEDAAPAYINALSGALDFYNGVMDFAKPYLQYLWEEFLQPIASWTGGKIVEILGWIGDKLSIVGDWLSEHAPELEDVKKDLEPITDCLQEMGKFLGKILGLAWDNFEKNMSTLWNYILKPLWDYLLKPLLSTFWEKLKGMAKILSGIFEALNLIMEGDWEGAGKSIVEGLTDGIETIWNGSFVKKYLYDPIVNGFKNLFGIHSPSTVFEGFGKNIMQGLANGLIAKKDATIKTWNTVKGWFTNITKEAKVQIPQKWADLKGKWNSLMSNFQNKEISISAKVGGVVGNFKQTINDSLIKPLNKKLPSIFPQIPYLAQGGWFARNNPTLAVVGDNRREPEIVAPESKIYDQTLKAIKDSGGAGGKQQIEMIIYHKYEDGRTIIQKVNQAQIDAGEILLLT